MWNSGLSHPVHGTVRPVRSPRWRSRLRRLRILMERFIRSSFHGGDTAVPSCSQPTRAPLSVLDPDQATLPRHEHHPLVGRCPSSHPTWLTDIEHEDQDHRGDRNLGRPPHSRAYRRSRSRTRPADASDAACARGVADHAVTPRTAARVVAVSSVLADVPVPGPE